MPVTLRIRCARCLPVIRLRCHVICLHVAFCHVIICISYHVIMCIALAYVFVSCIRALFPLSVLHSGTPMSSDASFCLFLCAGVKLSRKGPRFAKRPCYSTGRPPVKFRTIWISFDTPTVNRGTKKASCVLQPNTPPIWPKTHQTLLHRLGRSITIVWAKTAPHLDSDRKSTRLNSSHRLTSRMPSSA